SDRTLRQAPATVVTEPLDSDDGVRCGIAAGKPRQIGPAESAVQDAHRHVDPDAGAGLLLDLDDPSNGATRATTRGGPVLQVTRADYRACRRRGHADAARELRRRRAGTGHRERGLRAVGRAVDVRDEKRMRSE